MDTPVRKDVLTTGQVARICNVAPRTVSKWFDTGQLRGYRIPGSKDRRIPLQALIRFMKAHGMPLTGIESGQTRILILDNELDMADLLSRTLSEEGSYEVHTAATALEAGMLLERIRPHVLLVDISLPDVNPHAIARLIAANPDLQGIKLIAMSASVSDGETQALRQQGFDNILHKPFEIRQVMRAIEESMAAFA
jgi:excisionase family DNA binding protein